jgi:hypothetical protein
LRTRFEFLRQLWWRYRSCAIWRRGTWCLLAFRVNAVPTSTFEVSNKGSCSPRNVRKHSVTSQKPWVLVLCYLFLMWTVECGIWNLTTLGRFWIRSTKSINLWLIITCNLFLQGYGERSLPWTRHGYAVQIAFLSSRSRSVSFAVTHTDTRVYMAVGRM